MTQAKHTAPPITTEEFRMMAFMTCAEVSTDGFLFVSTDGNIAYINKPYCDYIGVKQEDVIHKRVTDVISKSKLIEIANDINYPTEYNVVFEVAKNQYVDKERYVVVTRSNVSRDGHSYGAIAHVKFIRNTLEIANAIHDVYDQLEYYKGELQRLSASSYSFDTVQGNSPEFVATKKMALRAAKNEFSVLITGDTGVGKEVFANAIHYASSRHDKPFIRVNCAAIPGELMESELFGYVEGSFTGAKKGGKKGKFELANGGTIFLDEIGELPLVMQAKLLRILQERELEPVGSTTTIPLDIRIMSATNKDLEKEVREKRFRSDLYYRLNVIEIHIPSLKERKDDIPLYIDLFLGELNEKYHTNIHLDEDTSKLLASYSWPGNLRELKNTLERCYALSENGIIHRYTLPGNILRAAAYSNLDSFVKEHNTLESIMNEMERWLILEEIRHNKGNLKRTAEKLGIHRTTLYKKMEKLEISREQIPDRADPEQTDTH
jgi:PAS domain S-box-containing protein